MCVCVCVTLCNIATGKDTPHIKDINNHVVPKWGSKWRQLGTQLNIERYLMDNIEQDHPADCESCCSKMFSEWLDSNPTACWEDLFTALDNLSPDGM